MELVLQSFCCEIHMTVAVYKGNRLHERRPRIRSSSSDAGGDENVRLYIAFLPAAQ
jgi:hypothetical protein